LVNCIVACNAAWADYNYTTDSTCGYCCTVPLPANGFGNITNNPLFVDLASGNLRLQSNSPCINAGDNASVVGNTDLDGRPRIVGGTVDIGAYEYQPCASGAFIGWLQQYGLATDGSADYSDPDGDGLNNWQEWRCGTNPTNSLSALRMISALPNGTKVTVTWQSVAGITYFLERTTNLPGPASVFTPVATGIPGQDGTTSYLDTNAIGTRPAFYRAGVGN
jgi:hypothetical protein